MMQSELSPKRRLTKSLVIGIHNWRRYLPLSLPSIARCSLYLDEIIFVLDRLTEEDQQRCSEAIHTPLVTWKCDISILFKDHAVWQYRPAETFSYGFSYATGDILYVSAEDIVLDPKNFSDSYWTDPSVGIVDFRYYSHDPHQVNFHVAWDTILLKVSDKFGYGTTRSGLFGVRRTVYDQVGGLIDHPSEQDWLRREVKEAGYKHLHVKSTCSLHLRPGYDKRRQLLQGVSRRKQGVTFKRTVLHSVLHIKPLVLRGFLSCGAMD